MFEFYYLVPPSRYLRNQESNSSRIFSRFFSIVRDLLLFNDKWFGNDGIDSPKA